MNHLLKNPFSYSVLFAYKQTFILNLHRNGCIQNFSNHEITEVTDVTVINSDYLNWASTFSESGFGDSY